MLEPPKKPLQRQDFGPYHLTTAQILCSWTLMVIFIALFLSAFGYLVLHHEWGIGPK